MPGTPENVAIRHTCEACGNDYFLPPIRYLVAPDSQRIHSPLYQRHLRGQMCIRCYVQQAHGREGGREAGV